MCVGLERSLIAWPEIMIVTTYENNSNQCLMIQCKQKQIYRYKIQTVQGQTILESFDNSTNQKISH